MGTRFSDGSVRFDAANEALLARYVDELQSWADDAFRLCGPPTSQPVKTVLPDNVDHEVVRR